MIPRVSRLAHLVHGSTGAYIVAWPMGLFGGLTLVVALVTLKGWPSITGLSWPTRREKMSASARYVWIGGVLGLLAVVLARVMPPWATALIAGMGGPLALAVFSPNLMA
jgi:hypothetical protein